MCWIFPKSRPVKWSFPSVPLHWGPLSRKWSNLFRRWPKKGITLSLDIADDVTTATSDQRRLEQVLLNLLNNAVKFTEKGEVQISCRSDNDHYLLSVSDTGIGIQPEELPGLFQPFHQIDTGLSRKHEGTGLGLSIAKGFVEILGGKIWLESPVKNGKGSRFIFTVPFERDKETI